ncbi:MAG: ABC transporter ATP-binding protein [Abditibacteriota bacterium]|nr:ABC transporter ATP-binding protein [Abditibacteriota bacterium]
MIAINIKNLTFGYDVPVLNNVNITINDGEFVGIIGPNGAGKSTLIKCICNIIETKGSVEVFGKPKEDYTSKDLAKIISYVPQSSDRVFNFTVKDYILMSRYPYTKSFASLGEIDYEACEEAMSVTGTKAYQNRLITTLSGGERQKVAIASAMAQKGKIMLFDEPTTFLDPKHISQVMKIVKRANENATVLMVTHELNTIFDCTRVIALKGGEIVFDDKPGAFFENRVAEEVFDTEFNYIEFENKYFIYPK